MKKVVFPAKRNKDFRTPVQRKKRSIQKLRADMAKIPTPKKSYIIGFYPEVQEVWDYWNSMPNLRTHKSSNTKIGKIFEKNGYRLFHGWFYAKKEVPQEFQRRKFTLNDIKKSIGRLDDCFDPKFNIPLSSLQYIRKLSINSFLYNEYSARKTYSTLRSVSSFLFYLTNEVTGQEVKLNKDIPSYFLKKVYFHLENNQFNIQDKNIQYDAIKSINKIYQRIPCDKSGSIIDRIEEAVPEQMVCALKEKLKSDIDNMSSVLFVDIILPKHLKECGVLDGNQYQEWLR